MPLNADCVDRSSLNDAISRVEITSYSYLPPAEFQLVYVQVCDVDLASDVAEKVPSDALPTLRNPYPVLTHV
jgi:hypothetical protein